MKSCLNRSRRRAHALRLQRSKCWGAEARLSADRASAGALAMQRKSDGPSGLGARRATARMAQCARRPIGVHQRMDVASVFAEPLVDLGTQTPVFAGIYAPQSSIGATKVGVTSQFLENAEQYHRAYFDTEYWNFLLGNALEAAGEPSAPTRIIDIGSGSGNSVIPLANRFPDAEIIATDISPQLLAILRDFLRQRPDSDRRFGLVCVDAMAAQYQPESPSSPSVPRSCTTFSNRSASWRPASGRLRPAVGDLLRAVRGG